MSRCLSIHSKSSQMILYDDQPPSLEFKISKSCSRSPYVVATHFSALFSIGTTVQHATAQYVMRNEMLYARDKGNRMRGFPSIRGVRWDVLRPCAYDACPHMLIIC